MAGLYINCVLLSCIYLVPCVWVFTVLSLSLASLLIILFSFTSKKYNKASNIEQKMTLLVTKTKIIKAHFQKEKRKSWTFLNEELFLFW